MRLKIIITEQQFNKLQTTNQFNLSNLVNRFKKTNTWKIISDSFDKDLVKFISNIVAKVPSLKGKEQELLGNVLKIDDNPLMYVKKYLGKNMNEQSTAFDAFINISLWSMYIWLGYLILALPLGLPLTDDDVADLKNKIKSRKEGKEAARKYKEWQKYLNSDEYKKQQEASRQLMLQQQEEQNRIKSEIDKQERLKYASQADEKEKELEKLKLSGVKLSQIKSLEMEIALLRRNSYEQLSNEWNIFEEKYKLLKLEYNKAIQDEKNEVLRQQEIERQKKIDDLKKQEDDLKKQIELEKQRKEKLNLPLKKFVGKTVNFYNDKNQQVLYGKDTIEKMEFDDSSKYGGRSGIYIYTKDGLEYEIICLSNPDRLADYVVLHKQYTKDFKYNNGFVNAVKQTAPNFCKKPKADFGMKYKPKKTNYIS